MNRCDIDRLGSLPIESVAERLGLRVERHKALCPFHDDSHPSLTFSVSRNRFKCFVCDAHGGVIDLAMKVLGCGFREACKWLSNEHNVILEEWKPAEQHSTLYTKRYTFTPEKYAKYFERPFINQAAGEFLFEKRRLDPRIVRWCKLTSYTDRNGIPWLQIPYFDMDGNLTGVQWRNLRPSKSPLEGDLQTERPSKSPLKGDLQTHYPPPLRGNEGVPRFRFPYGSQCHIYNLPVLKLLKPGEELYIAEGCSDCWSLLSSGHKAIAIPSATLLKSQDLLDALYTIHSTLNIHIYPDADIPGERLFLKLKEYLETPSPLNPHPSPLIRHQLPSGCKDYSDYYLLNLVQTERNEARFNC